MDSSGYDLVDTFTLSDAGFLLIGEYPGSRDSIIRKKANMMAVQLVRDVKERKLTARKPDCKLSELGRRLNREDYAVDSYEPYPSVAITRIVDCQEAGTDWIVTRDDLRNWAVAKGIKPVFLFPELYEVQSNGFISCRTNPQKNNTKLTPSQKDKGRFQGLAKVMWKNNSNLTRTKIIDSEEMEFYKMTYTGKNTLQDWLREIDPRPMNARRGRPKNTRQPRK